MSESFFTRGLEGSEKMPGYSSIQPRFANRFYLPVEKSADIVLLDDKSVNIYEHGIFIKGDTKSMKLRVTCASPGPDPVPQKCRICNAMIKDERIWRQYINYLSIIDLSVFKVENKTFTHTRKLLPLTGKAAKKLLRRLRDMETLVGARFKVYRTDKTSPRVGDDWEYQERVNLAKFFKGSPRLKSIQAYWSKQGKELTLKEAKMLLIKPFDYAKELEPTPKVVNYFLAYIGLGDDQVKKDGEEEEKDVPAYDYSSGKSEESFKDFEDDAPSVGKKGTKKKKVKKGAKKKKKKKVLS